MDGFDDLLSSSSRALEENPFANPFEKPRSSSPDPWASYGTQQAEDRTFQDESYASPFGSSFSTRDEVEFNPQPSDEEHSILAEERKHEHGEEPIAHHRANTGLDETGADRAPQSPGFRESLVKDDASSTLASEKSTSSPSSSVEPTRAPSPELSSPKTPTRSTPPVDSSLQQRSSPVPKAPSPPPTSPTFQNTRVSSPLDFPSPGITQSFASLALGGESLGGWQDAPSPFASDLEPSASQVSDTAGDASNEPKSSAPLSEKEDESSSRATGKSGSIPLFMVSVEDPQKVGDPIRPYILYTVHTKTSMPNYSKPVFSVLRRYSDFLWLYETLAMNNPGVFVPPVPEKSSFGRFDNQFIHQRRLGLEKCIQKIANHPVLCRDPDLKLFLESDTFALDIKHRQREIAQERGGLMSSIGQTIAGPRFYETDDWFDKKKTYLDNLEAQLRGLVRSVESVSKQRAELAIATGEFAQAIGELSSSELSKQLTHSLAVMSDVEKKAQDLHHTQATDDAVTFMSTAEEYVRIINTVRLAFSSRVRCHAQWQSAEGELRRVKQVHERARSQGRIAQDRIGHSLAQIGDAERKALDAKHEFEKCGKLIKSEMGRFEEERIRDFKISMEAFLEGMIIRQKELIASWESYQNILLKRVNEAQRSLASSAA